MKHRGLAYCEFCKLIAKDFGIELMQKHKMYFMDYPKINGKIKIKAPYDSVIVDLDKGKEYPYMLNAKLRNEEKLLNFDYIYFLRAKPLEQILKEVNITLKKEPCNICEGGGWYRDGVRYFYRTFYCEI